MQLKAVLLGVIAAMFFISSGVAAVGVYQKNIKINGFLESDPHKKEKWKVISTKNPFDGSNASIIALQSDENDLEPDTYTLYMRCMSGRTEVFIDWKAYLGNDLESRYKKRKNIGVLFDDGAPLIQEWSISTDNKSTFSADSVTMMEKITQSEKMVVTTTPYEGSPVMAVFDIAELNEPLSQLVRGCKTGDSIAAIGNSDG